MISHEYILAGLKAFSLLDRKATDEIGWIALKLGVSRRKAAKAIENARAYQLGKDEASHQR